MSVFFYFLASFLPSPEAKYTWQRHTILLPGNTTLLYSHDSPWPREAAPRTPGPHMTHMRTIMSQKPHMSTRHTLISYYYIYNKHGPKRALAQVPCGDAPWSRGAACRTSGASRRPSPRPWAASASPWTALINRSSVSARTCVHGRLGRGTGCVCVDGAG